MPLALDVDWSAVEKAAIAGMDYSQLSRSFGVPETAIRKRASRYSWPVAYKVGSKAVSQIPVTKAKNEAISSTVTANLADIHATTATQLVNAAAKSLGAFAEKPAVVESWQDAATAYKVQRLAAGVDREGAEVKVNVAMFSELRAAPADQATASEPDCWEAEGEVVQGDLPAD